MSKDIDQRIEEIRQWLEDQGWGDDEDGRVTCGRMLDGVCSLAGSEECDFDCPFRDEV